MRYFNLVKKKKCKNASIIGYLNQDNYLCKLNFALFAKSEMWLRIFVKKNCFCYTIYKFGKFKSGFVLFAKTLFGHHKYTTDAKKCKHASAVQYVN